MASGDPQRSRDELPGGRALRWTWRNCPARVLDGITGDYFDAVPVSDGVALRMSDNVAEVLADLLHRLLRLLEDGQAEPRGRFRRGRPVEEVLRDMFPDAYRDRAEARSFRERHAALLRDTTAVRRVRDRCVSGTEHVIDHAEVDDGVVALGMGRFWSSAGTRGSSTRSASGSTTCRRTSSPH